jgi:hypothetical protein
VSARRLNLSFHLRGYTEAMSFSGARSASIVNRSFSLVVQLWGASGRVTRCLKKVVPGVALKASLDWLPEGRTGRTAN